MGETTESKSDIDKLKTALLSVEEALGPGADLCIQLKAQLKQETHMRRKAIPPHQLLLRLEKRMAYNYNEHKLQKLDRLMGEAEQDLRKAKENLESIQSQGRGLQQLSMLTPEMRGPSSWARRWTR